ncbi:EAL domain-containing protein [Ideonella dechloratans]|uniref:EAL domain-containing protein n=1 Tax=Ideonella dechloratans TaxID=36863 RepID=A0A643FAJ2_IDEDE|nr:EAL domain-containing protein [Ideonella dechloratans]KAB0581072.1 EAL domain-containing protein [Ideonella dechloratans]UFU09191.1 EAL domain-containing protein [Ideonella dechloratans]
MRSSGASSLQEQVEDRPKVLLVDDDEVNLMLVSAALSKHGFDVTEASSGDEALRILGGWIQDLVVLDARMPGLDGFETCEELRGMYGLENVPVLMLTGLDDEASIKRAYDAGATDFFVKSNQWSLLAGRLRHMLRAARTQQELIRSRAKLARAQDLARMGSFEWWHHPERGLPFGMELSEEALRVFGSAPDDRLSFRDLLRMMTREERHGLIRGMRQIVRQVFGIAMDVPLSRGVKRNRIIHVEGEPEFGEYGQCVGYTGIVQDVTERHQAEDSIRKLANKDPLTQLPNRRQFNWRAERALEQARRMGHKMALLLIDLDRFKNINDTLGHAAGDELLLEVSMRLRGCVRHSDQIFDGTVEAVGSRFHRALEAVGRLGGDEFVALLPEVEDERDAERVAQRILEALRQPVYVADQEFFATASVGIALYPQDGQTVADLLRNADVAMYAAKDRGRNGSVLYTPNLAVRDREKLELETALHKAIERNELVLYYQPKVDAQSGRLMGVEALMRWRRGDALVPPNEFIPMAEETGLIVPLSEWALREAARQAHEWRQAFGFNESIAVNMPSRMFLRQDLVDLIHEAVKPYGIPHRMLLLEITESSLMKDLQSILPTLHRLNEVGVQISVDDFGTGYSSLQYLTELPISELKIDRSFVNKLGREPKASEVIHLIISLAQALSLRVVAEGVENTTQMNLLRSLQCRMMQGYLISRPMPGADLPAWVAEHVAVPSATAAAEPLALSQAGETHPAASR